MYAILKSVTFVVVRRVSNCTKGYCWSCSLSTLHICNLRASRHHFLSYPQNGDNKALASPQCRFHWNKRLIWCQQRFPHAWHLGLLWEYLPKLQQTTLPLSEGGIPSTTIWMYLCLPLWEWACLLYHNCTLILLTGCSLCHQKRSCFLVLPTGCILGH